MFRRNCSHRAVAARARGGRRHRVRLAPAMEPHSVPARLTLRITEEGPMTESTTEILPAIKDSGMLMHILERAAQAPEFDLERVSRLLDLKDRWDRAQAARDYAGAMVAFKAAAPTLHKDKHVKFTNRAGTVTEYDHATHYEVTTKIAV